MVMMLSFLLSAAFVLRGIAHLTGGWSTRERFEAMRLSIWVRWLVGIGEGVLGIMLSMPMYREDAIAGLGILLALSVAGVFVRQGPLQDLAPPLALSVFLALLALMIA